MVNLLCALHTKKVEMKVVGRVSEIVKILCQTLRVSCCSLSIMEFCSISKRKNREQCFLSHMTPTNKSNTIQNNSPWHTLNYCRSFWKSNVNSNPCVLIHHIILRAFCFNVLGGFLSWPKLQLHETTEYLLPHHDHINPLPFSLVWSLASEGRKSFHNLMQYLFCYYVWTTSKLELILVT